MKIIFSHTFRSIKKHFGQPLVIVITVAIVTILLFASLSMRDIFYNFQLANLSRMAADTDVEIKGELFSGTKLDEFISLHTDEVVYVDKYLETSGLIEDSDKEKGNPTVVLLEATDVSAFLSRHKDRLSFLKGLSSDAKVKYPNIMIGKALADKKGYDVGDEVEIYVGLYDRYETFTIAYIFDNEGFFANTVVYNVLTDITSLGDKGVYTNAFIKLKDTCDKTVFQRELSDHMANPTLEIKDAVDYGYINNLVASNEKLLTIALIFIIALVIFILFSAYTVVAKNRAEEMIVFKAVGATPLQIFWILTFEVLLYGLIGGVIGVIAARFSMQIAVMNIIPMYVDAVRYSVQNYVIALLLGIVISFLGALIPIVRLTKKTVKNLSATGSKMVKKVPIWLLVVPIVVVIACVLSIVFVTDYAEIFTIIMIVAVAVSIMIASPYTLSGISFLFGKRKGTSSLASCSVKRNAEAVSLSCMLGVVIAFTFIAVSLVNVIIDASIPYNTRFHSDYVVQSLSGVDDIEEVNEYLKGTHGIRYTCMAYYDSFDFTYKGQDKTFTVYAVNSSEDLRSFVTLTEEEKRAFDNESHAAVVSYDMMNRFGKKNGEKLTLRGDDYAFEFKIVACDTVKTSDDRIIFVKRSECDYPFENAIIFVQTKGNVSGRDLYLDLKESLNKKGYYVLKYDEWANATSVGVQGIATLLRVLQILVGFVGFIGIINMTIAMLMSRKREFGIFRSSGMSQKKYISLLFYESLEIAICGSVIGMIFSLVVNTLIPSFAVFIDRYINIAIPWSIPVIAVTVIVAYVAIYVAIGSGKRVDRFGIERNIA